MINSSFFLSALITTLVSTREPEGYIETSYTCYLLIILPDPAIVAPSFYGQRLKIPGQDNKEMHGDNSHYYGLPLLSNSGVVPN